LNLYVVPYILLVLFSNQHMTHQLFCTHQLSGN